VLTPPEPRVLAAIKNAWRRDRKPANILLVLDTSGSMNDEQRLERAKAGARRLLQERRAAGRGRADDLLRQDPAAGGAGAVVEERQRAALAGARPDRRRRHRVLRRDDEAFDSVRAQKATDRINAVVLLTDGRTPTRSSRSRT
jgi:Ca-activated chloride channel family protein